MYCESSNAHYQAIKAAPHSGSSDWTLTLPPTVPSVSGQALTATTAGVASWTTLAAAAIDCKPNFGVSSAADQVWQGSYDNFNMPTVLWTSEASLWDTTNFKFTVPAGKGGKYIFFLNFFIGANANYYVRTYINGTTEGQYQSHASSTSGNKVQTATFHHDLDAADYVEVQHYTGNNFTNGGAKFMGMRIDD